jgi:glycosyltransferase involved in cell wall biosynthesis
MNICMLSYYYWPVPAGGTENQCRRLAAALTARGHQCLILTCRCRFTDVQQEKEYEVTIFRIFSLEIFINFFQRLRKKNKRREIISDLVDSKKNQFCNLLKLKNKISKKINKFIVTCNIILFSFGVLFFLARKHDSFDILHVHTAEWIAGLAAFAGKIFKLPVVCKGATMPVFPSIQDVPLAFLCAKWRKKPHFITLTQAMKHDFMANGIPESKITIIPNGVPIPLRLSAVEKNSHFLYIGNFGQAAWKAFDILLAAWAAFHQQRPTPRLLLLGGGNAEPWQVLARQLGCAESVDFLGYQTCLPAFFEQSCCLLLPSRNEGLSNALLEAQSWGIPAIVSDIPGNRAVVAHQKNGLIVPVGDSKALAEAMLHLHDSPELRKEYSAAARKRMEDVFALDKVADQTVVLYQQLAG